MDAVVVKMNTVIILYGWTPIFALLITGRGSEKPMDDVVVKKNTSNGMMYNVNSCKQ